MPRLRRRTSWVLGGWLLFQFVGIGAPLLVAAKTAVEELCFCPDAEPGAACPMHQAKHKSSDSAGGSLKDGCSPTDTALLALMGGTGIVPQTFSLSLADLVSEHAAISAPQPTSFVALPDSPPPRA
jgi:hypothetical protein